MTNTKTRDSKFCRSACRNRTSQSPTSWTGTDFAYPFLMDRSGATSIDYGVATTPTTYFVSPDGEIVDSTAGVVSQRSHESNLTTYLGS